MIPAELAEVVQLHGMWMRGEAGGVRADLRGADLRWANLSGANRNGVAVDRVLLAGLVARYYALIFSGQDGNVYAEYGCETKPRTVEQWREELPALCARHASLRAKTYERVLTGLLAIDWRMVDEEVAP